MNRFSDINRLRRNSPRRMFITGILALTALLLSFGGAMAQEENSSSSNSEDFTSWDIADLMNVEITSVSRHAEKLSDAAAAVCVITHEDIRRSGLTSIPEILRMATGLQVANIDSSKWAISARGFTNRFSNKLLVLIDGRSVYTPFFSGVWWDVQDTSLDSIDRIEIIRGPGAALWGANAVNGIINIITKKATAADANRMAVSAEMANGESGLMTTTGKIGSGAYRIYTKSTSHNGYVNALGDTTHDGWRQQRDGIRVDLEPSDRDTITIQGDAYRGITEQTLSRYTLTEPYYQTYLDQGELSGGNCLARLSHSFSDNSSAQLQMYYDRTYRKDGLHQETRRTVDVDFQHDFAWGSKNKCIWGLGYRSSEDSLIGNDYIWFSLESQKETLYSWFVQNEIPVVPNKLRLTLGTKVEDNYFTGYETQPNVRLLWEPNSNETVWAAVSKAARTPSRLERDGSMNNGVSGVTDDGLPILYVVTGNPNMLSENLTAYELGYRVQPSDKLTIDATTFYNVYDDFRSYDAGIPYYVTLPTPHIVQTLMINNSMNAKTYGLELALNYRAVDHWRIAAGYTGINISMDEDPGSNDPIQATYPQDTPRNQFSLRSYLDLPHNFELDTMIYHVGSLPHYRVPSYTRVDVRLGWHPTKGNLEFSAGVRNLLDSHHIEFGSSYTEQATEVEREYFTNVTRRF